MSVNIIIGADHGGFELKEKICGWLQKEGHFVTDIGAKNFDPADDYPDFAAKVSEILLTMPDSKGIVICGSGVGASIAANKINGIRAAVCHDTYSASQGVEHDDMNILCIGARVIGVELAMEIIKSFVRSSFSKEDRHVRRLKKILNLETGLRE